MTQQQFEENVLKIVEKLNTLVKENSGEATWSLEEGRVYMDNVTHTWFEVDGDTMTVKTDKDELPEGSGTIYTMLEVMKLTRVGN